MGDTSTGIENNHCIGIRHVDLMDMNYIEDPGTSTWAIETGGLQVASSRPDIHCDVEANL